MKKYLSLYIYIGLYLFLELIFKVLTYKEFLLLESLYTTLYALFIATIMFSISIFLKQKANKIVLITISFITSFYFALQFCVYKVYKVYYSILSLSATDQVVGFAAEIPRIVWQNLLYIIIFFIPPILIVIFRKKIVFGEFTKKNKIIIPFFILITYGIFSLGLLINKDEDYSAYSIYYDYYDIPLSVNKMGILSTLHQDIIKTVISFEENIVLTPGNPSLTNPENPGDITYELNNLDIDFSSISSKTQNINDMTAYFAAETGTYQNEYTSYFEGKNLVYIMAESFSDIAVDPVRTPTLYKLINEGFVFENFYSPTIYSTIGGEFQLLTGIYPGDTFLEKFKAGNNEFIYGLSTMFEEAGYNTYAYHNNTYTFQNRHKYLPSLGFDNYMGCYNGLEKLMSCSWLQSDVEMIDVTTNDFVNDEEPFMVFYASVSGHSPYVTGAEFANKYLSLVPDTYSSGIRSYLATQIEFDRALEKLISDLTEAGKLEDTVIMFAGDHYPYTLSLDEINEASNYTKDKTIEVNRSNLAIWNSEMNSIKVDKIGSQIDILPTIYNLFGLPYDSRLIIGKDILSSTPGLAMFSDKSWVSDYGSYFSSTNTFIPVEGKEIPEDYVTQMNQIVRSKINISGMIMKYDYYSLIP